MHNLAYQIQTSEAEVFNRRETKFRAGFAAK